jgi:hypothetical protein
MSDLKNFNPDDLNENLLKTTAITFSLEGISRDLETYVQKKVTFNNRNLKHVSDIIRSLSTCDAEIQRSFLKKGSSVTKILDQSLAEIENVNSILTFIIQKTISKENILNSDLEESSGIEESEIEDEDPNAI